MVMQLQRSAEKFSELFPLSLLVIYPSTTKIELNLISRGTVDKIKISVRNEIFNRNWFCNLSPSLATDNQAQDWNFQSGMKISNREWTFRARMGFSVRRGLFCSSVRARTSVFSISGPSGLPTFQRRRDNNNNQICVFEEGGHGGAERKIVQKHDSSRERHDNKFLKVQIWCQKIVVIAWAPNLRRAKSCDSCRRIASESYHRDSNHYIAFIGGQISLKKTWEIQLSYTRACQNASLKDAGVSGAGWRLSSIIARQCVMRLRMRTSNICLYTVRCGNSFRVGVRSENASMSGLRVGPSKPRLGLLGWKTSSWDQKKGSLGKGVFQKLPFSRASCEFRNPRHSRGYQNCEFCTRISRVRKSPELAILNLLGAKEPPKRVPTFLVHQNCEFW